MIGEEEKIALLIDELEDVRCDNFDADTDEDKTLKEAIRVIKALEQKSCNKCVYSTKDGYCQYDDITEAIPPVNPQDSKAVKVLRMRDATPEERELIDKYIKSISKPTGVNFWDLEQEPCGDMVSRGVFEQVMWERDVAIEQLKELGYGLGEKPRTGHWIKYGVPRCEEQHYQCTNCDYYINFGKWGEFYTKEFKYCPNCGAKMGESENKK